MKGKLEKTNDGWVMKYGEPVELKVAGSSYFHNHYNQKLPLHPDDVKKYEWLYQAYTIEEFNNLSDNNNYLFSIENGFAKIIKEE